jgi:hypothetical protein
MQQAQHAVELKRGLCRGSTTFLGTAAVALSLAEILDNRAGFEAIVNPNSTLSVGQFLAVMVAGAIAIVALTTAIAALVQWASDGWRALPKVSAFMALSNSLSRLRTRPSKSRQALSHPVPRDEDDT